MIGDSTRQVIEQRLRIAEESGEPAPEHQRMPVEPRNLKASGISRPVAESLVLKAVLQGQEPTVSNVSQKLHLPYPIVDAVVENLLAIGFMEILGSTGRATTDQLRLALTHAGRNAALEAFERNSYLGPAPVSLKAFYEQVRRQSITGESVPRSRIRECFGDLVVPEALVTQLGPAINSGRSLLLYGAAGNGKTSLAERMGRMFRSDILIPYCVEVDGEIIKFFDPAVHHQLEEPKEEKTSVLQKLSIERDDRDKRWLRIKRPIVITGGELTLEMLDLQFNDKTGFYEAPVHMKGLNGIVMIDDFGRQIVAPERLLNRWIVPLEKRIDYLKLHTGKTFEIPFDALVVFSTNLTPKNLMDPAFLRRIPYKVKIAAPTLEHFAAIFRRAADEAELEVDEETIQNVARFIEERQLELAAYQPKFIVDQVIAACRYEAIDRVLAPDLVERALANLHTD